jgi:hypothetical protein
MEQVLKMTREDAVRHYPKAPPELKAIFETTFGKATFSSDIRKRINSFADVVGLSDWDYEAVLPFKRAMSRMEVAANGFVEACMAVEVINEGWVPDYDDSNQPKFEIFWDMRNGGLVFDYVDFWGSYSPVGSRLCFRTRALAEWAAKQTWFIEICKKFMR